MYDNYVMCAFCEGFTSWIFFGGRGGEQGRGGIIRNDANNILCCRQLGLCINTCYTEPRKTKREI
jgi:hypothetical protein